MQAQVAQAQAACVDQNDLSDAVVYAMPVLADAFSTKCTAELSADGFWATEGDSYVAQFADLSETTWPGAARVLTTFMAVESKGESGLPALAEIFSSGSPETVRPFVDLTLSTMIATELKTEDCGKIERGLSLMAPLPPENMGGLMAFLVDMAGVKNPSLCPYEGE